MVGEKGEKIGDDLRFSLSLSQTLQFQQTTHDNYANRDATRRHTTTTLNNNVPISLIRRYYDR